MSEEPRAALSALDTEDALGKDDEAGSDDTELTEFETEPEEPAVPGTAGLLNTMMGSMRM